MHAVRGSIPSCHAVRVGSLSFVICGAAAIACSGDGGAASSPHDSGADVGISTFTGGGGGMWAGGGTSRAGATASGGAGGRSGNAGGNGGVTPGAGGAKPGNGGNPGNGGMQAAGGAVDGGAGGATAPDASIDDAGPGTGGAPTRDAGSDDGGSGRGGTSPRDASPEDGGFDAAGTGGAGGAPGTGRFAGKWSTDKISEREQCGSDPLSTYQFSNTVTIKARPGGLTITEGWTDCSVDATFSGDVATIAGGETCLVPKFFDDGSDATITFQTSSFTVPTAKQGTQSFKYTVLGALNEMCTITETGFYTKP